jgi:hydrogenase 3 maturation protease
LKSSDPVSGADLRRAISERIRGKVAIAAIGNIMRSDDGLGSRLIEMLRSRGASAALFDCGTAPENYIFPILSTGCDTVILIDAADLGERPGQARVLDLDEIMNVSFSTHSPSPRLFTDLLRTGREDLGVFIVSVQPKSTMLGGPVSEEVLRGCEALASILVEALESGKK